MTVELFTDNGDADTVGLFGVSSEERVCGRGRLQAAPQLEALHSDALS